MSKDFKIGVDLGGTCIKLAFVDNRGRISFRRRVETPSNAGKANLIDVIICNIRDTIKQSGLKRRDILGVGMGVPGPVDFKNGVVRYFPNIKGWDNVPLRSMMQRRLSLRVALDNDVNAMTLAEHRLGAGRGAMNLICLTLGTGVGGGLIINGEVYRGSTMYAGEIGHMPINEKGPRCNCRGIACLERYIGNRYILQRTRRIFGRDMTLERLSALARHGNKKAIAIWQDIARKLAVALTGAVNLLNPDMIVIGGGVSNAGELILAPLRKEIKLRPMRDQASHVKVVRARLGEDAGIIGASLLI